MANGGLNFVHDPCAFSEMSIPNLCSGGRGRRGRTRLAILNRRRCVCELVVAAEYRVLDDSSPEGNGLVCR